MKWCCAAGEELSVGEEEYEEDVSECESPPRPQTISLGLISLTFHLFPLVDVRLYVYKCVFGKERLCWYVRPVCICVQEDPGRSPIAVAIAHTYSESSTLLSPYSEIRLWIPLALQFDQSADLQPPLQHTDEA